MSNGLAYAAGAVLIACGAAHLVPTRAVIAGFGPITRDNRLIVAMEWIAEGITHVFIGLLVIFVAARHVSSVAPVYGVTAGALVAFAILTALTGSRTPVVWFRICPFVLAGVAAMLVAATVVAG